MESDVELLEEYDDMTTARYPLDHQCAATFYKIR